MATNPTPVRRLNLSGEGTFAILREGILALAIRQHSTGAAFIPLKRKEIDKFLAENNLPPFDWS